MNGTRTTLRRIEIIAEWLILAFIFAFVAASLAHGQEDPSKKPGSPNLETCLKRAVERAKVESGRRGARMTRATVAPSDAREFQSYVVIFEFKDGSLGFFQGGSEAESDQLVIVEKEHVPLVVDADGRVPAR